MDGLSCDELCDLLGNELPQEHYEVAVCEVRQHALTGKDLACLTTEELSEVFPVMGVRKSVARAIVSIQSHSAVSIASTNSDNRVPVPPSRSDRSKSCLMTTTTNSGWEKTLQIPVKYSSMTMQAISTGVLTKRARIEIINSLHTRMMQYTDYPTPDQYKTICWRLIEQFNTLEDKVGSGIGTWKEQLKQKFRNGRRSDATKRKIDDVMEDQNDSSENMPKQKRKKVMTKGLRCDVKIMQQETVPLSESDAIKSLDDSYTDLLQELKLAESQPNPKVGRIKHMMKKTFPGRRKWMINEAPTASDVLITFRKSNTLKREWQLILGLPKDHTFLKDWEKWKKKVLNYSTIESVAKRQSIKHFTEEFTHSSQTEFDEDLCFIKVLSQLLASKAKVEKLLYEFAENADINFEVKKIPVAPAIMLTRCAAEGHQLFISVEKMILTECDTLQEALVTLLATYFTFNIAYPPPLYPLYVFIQHHIFDVKDEQMVPNVVKIIYSALLNMNS